VLFLKIAGNRKKAYFDPCNLFGLNGTFDEISSAARTLYPSAITIAANKKNSPSSILPVMKKLFFIDTFYAVNALRAGVKRTDRGLK